MFDPTDEDSEFVVMLGAQSRIPIDPTELDYVLEQLESGKSWIRVISTDGSLTILPASSITRIYKTTLAKYREGFKYGKMFEDTLNKIIDEIPPEPEKEDYPGMIPKANPFNQ